MVGSTAASVQLRELKPGNIWFPTPSMPDGVAGAIVALMKAHGYKTVAIIGNQLPYALEVKKFLVPDLAKAGIKVLSNTDYPPDIKDMTALLTAVKQANPDGVIALSYPSDSILYMNQARELGVNAKFQFVMVGPAIDFFRKMFGPSADGIVSMGDWDPYLRACLSPSRSTTPMSRSSRPTPTIWECRVLCVVRDPATGGRQGRS